MSTCIQNFNMHVNKKYMSTYRRMNVNMHFKLSMHIKEKLHVNIQYTAPFLDDIIFHLVFRFYKEDLSEDWTPRSPVVLGISRISDLRMLRSTGSNSIRQIWSPRSLLTTGARWCSVPAAQTELLDLWALSGLPTFAVSSNSLVALSSW
jgi:hypothetical protein